MNQNRLTMSQMSRKAARRERRKKISRREVGAKAKKRRRDVSESTTQDWQSSFQEMWEKSMEQDNARFERKCSATRREGKWNKQTPY